MMILVLIVALPLLEIAHEDGECRCMCVWMCVCVCVWVRLGSIAMQAGVCHDIGHRGCAHIMSHTCCILHCFTAAQAHQSFALTGIGVLRTPSDIQTAAANYQSYYGSKRCLAWHDIPSACVCIPCHVTHTHVSHVLYSRIHMYVVFLADLLYFRVDALNTDVQPIVADIDTYRAFE